MAIADYFTLWSHRIGLFNHSNTDTFASKSVAVTLVNGTGTEVTSLGGGGGYAEDAAHVSGDLGALALAVRSDTATATAAAGDYTTLLTDANGRLYTNAAVASGGIASGAVASGAIASGAVSSGAIATGAIADMNAANTARTTATRVIPTQPISADGTISLDTMLALMTAASVPTMYNVTLTNARTQYSQALPATCHKLTIKCRTAFDMEFSFETGKVAGPTSPWATINAGAPYNESDANMSSLTVYLASAQAGVVAEIIAWT